MSAAVATAPSGRGSGNTGDSMKYVRASAAVLLLLGACDRPSTSPIVTPTQSAPPPRASFQFPAVPSGASVYYSPSIAVGQTLARVVLAPDSTFALQAIPWIRGLVAYSGKYTQRGSVITFGFQSGNATNWRATAQASGDSLTMVYNDAMAQS